MWCAKQPITWSQIGEFPALRDTIPNTETWSNLENLVSKLVTRNRTRNPWVGHWGRRRAGVPTALQMLTASTASHRRAVIRTASQLQVDSQSHHNYSSSNRAQCIQMPSQQYPNCYFSIMQTESVSFILELWHLLFSFSHTFSCHNEKKRTPDAIKSSLRTNQSILEPRHDTEY